VYYHAVMRRPWAVEGSFMGPARARVSCTERKLLGRASITKEYALKMVFWRLSQLYCHGARIFPRLGADELIYR
jgi:hypothetical protein